MKKVESRVVQDVSKIVISSLQILNELPKDEIDSLGGEEALVARTKVNIVDSLTWSGLQEWSGMIQTIDTNQTKKMNDFLNRLSQMLDVSFV